MPNLPRKAKTGSVKKDFRVFAPYFPKILRIFKFFTYKKNIRDYYRKELEVMAEDDELRQMMEQIRQKNEEADKRNAERIAAEQKAEQEAETAEEEEKKRKSLYEKYSAEQNEFEERKRQEEEARKQLVEKRSKSAFGRLLNQTEDEEGNVKRGIVTQLVLNAKEAAAKKYKENQEKAKIRAEENKQKKAELAKKKHAEDEKRKAEEAKKKAAKEHEALKREEERLRQKVDNPTPPKKNKAKTTDEIPTRMETPPDETLNVKSEPDFSELKKQHDALMKQASEIERIMGSQNARPKKKNPKDMTDEEYDSNLPQKLREIKKCLKSMHVHASRNDIERTLKLLSSKRNVLAVVATSSDFNSLFIYMDTDKYVDDIEHALEKTSGNLDLSFVYYISTNGTVYSGYDECYQVITEIFDDIRKMILRNHGINEDELRKIKNISIFRHLYYDEN